MIQFIYNRTNIMLLIFFIILLVCIGKLLSQVYNLHTLHFSFLKYFMDDDFFTENGQTLAAQSYQPPIHHQSHHEDEFQYANQQTHNQEVTHQTTQWQSSSNTYEEDEIAKNIRLQEQKIQERLRQKANEEYELKQKRKEKGSKDLQTFFQKKSEQAEARKIQNRKKQKEMALQKNSETAQGWAKVSKSVNLKQGQYKGQKDINRMRQAIIHKRQDQKI